MTSREYQAARKAEREERAAHYQRLRQTPIDSAAYYNTVRSRLNEAAREAFERRDYDGYREYIRTMLILRETYDMMASQVISND